MTTYCRIPLAWLDILPQGTLLKVQTPLSIKYMKMHYGMKQFTTIVTLATGGLANNMASFVNEREEFLGIILHYFYYYGMSSELSP